MTAGFEPFRVAPAEAGQTLAAVLRHRAAGGPLSWAQVRQLIAARRVQVNGTLCVDDARRLSAGEAVTVLTAALRPPPAAGELVVRHLDDHLVVVEKPAGILSVRNPEEAGWDEKRKGRQPTLDELLQKRLPRPRSREAAADWRVRPVHRLDRDTSGLTLYALSAAAEAKLIALFAKHEIERAYRAVVHGRLAGPATYQSHLVKNRGDGMRGTARLGAADPEAQRAVTHVRPVEHVGDAVHRRRLPARDRPDAPDPHPPVRGRPPPLRRPRVPRRHAQVEGAAAAPDRGPQRGPAAGAALTTGGVRPPGHRQAAGVRRGLAGRPGQVVGRAAGEAMSGPPSSGDDAAADRLDGPQLCRD